MEQLDYIIILLYFLGLIAVSVVMSRKIKNSEDMDKPQEWQPHNV